MLKICLVFWESEPQYAYKRYTYKKTMYPSFDGCTIFALLFTSQYLSSITVLLLLGCIRI